jgi:DNA-binding transcriptional MerR regulator
LSIALSFIDFSVTLKPTIKQRVVMPLNKTIQKQYFSITEVAEEMDLSASQLRYWEKEFALLKPKTNARGKRFYHRNDIDVIVLIKWLVKDQGYTISGARKAMRKRKDVAAQMELASKPQVENGTVEQNREELLDRLKSVRAELQALQA